MTEIPRTAGDYPCTPIPRKFHQETILLTDWNQRSLIAWQMKFTFGWTVWNFWLISKNLSRGILRISVFLETWPSRRRKFALGFRKNSRVKYLRDTNFNGFAATSEMSLSEIFPEFQSLRRELLPRNSTPRRTKILLQFSKGSKIPVLNFKTRSL